MSRTAAVLALITGIGVLGLILALGTRGPASAGPSTDAGSSPGEAASPVSPPDSNLAKATLAGGCFWCMEKPFDELEGVVSTISGFSGGQVEDPNYAEVAAGGTGHAEVVQITYDSTVVSYERILDVYWHNVDPTQRNGQFCDRGNQYRTAIYYHNAHQRKLAQSTKNELIRTGAVSRVVTEIEPFEAFYRADSSHQNFYKTHPARYQQYRQACGRDDRLEQLWGTDAPSS